MSVAFARSGRDEAVRWARDLLGRADWAVLDTETTGLDRSAQVIQVAIVAPDGVPLFDTLVRPHGPIPRDVIRVHGITDEMVADAPAYPAIHPRLAAILDGRQVICYNAAFDSRMLQQTARRNEIPPLAIRWDCAMEMYARYAGQRRSRGGYRWLPLPRGPEYPGARHQAIHDCLATLEVIRRMARG